LVPGFFVLAEGPEPFGAEVGIGTGRETSETGAGFGELAVVTEGAAVVEFLG